MNAWLVKHSWPIIITVAGIVSSYALLGHRVTILEDEVRTLRQESVETQVILAAMQKDIEYIRAAVSRLAD